MNIRDKIKYLINTYGEKDLEEWSEEALNLLIELDKIYSRFENDIKDLYEIWVLRCKELKPKWRDLYE